MIMCTIRGSTVRRIDPALKGGRQIVHRATEMGACRGRPWPSSTLHESGFLKVD